MNMPSGIGHGVDQSMSVMASNLVKEELDC